MYFNLQVSVNGIISFDREFSLDFPENFPSMDGDVHFSYLVAPYWSNVDTRISGSVEYESYFRGDSEASDQQMSRVEEFLRDEGNVSFNAQWMLLASWENVHPYPHGDSLELDRENPYLESVATCSILFTIKECPYFYSTYVYTYIHICRYTDP